MEPAIGTNPKERTDVSRVDIAGRTADILAAARHAAAGRGRVEVDWRGRTAGLAEIQIAVALEQALRRQGRELAHAGVSPETAAKLALCGVAGFALPGAGGTDE